MPPNPQLIGHLLHNRPVVNCGKQITQQKQASWMNGGKRNISDKETKSRCFVLCGAPRGEQLSFYCVILSILLNWLAFPCLPTGVLAQFACLGNVKQNRVGCVLRAEGTFVCRKWSAARYWGGIAYDQKGFHESRLREREREKEDLGKCSDALCWMS